MAQPMARPNLVDKVEAMAALACISELRASTLKVALRFLHHYNGQTGRCDPGIETLAYATGLCERTIYRAISELERIGLVRVLHRRGRGNTDFYLPDFEKIKCYNPPPRSAFPENGCQFGDNLTWRAHKPDSPIPENLTVSSGEHMNKHVNEHLGVKNLEEEQSGGSSDGVIDQEEIGHRWLPAFETLSWPKCSDDGQTRSTIRHLVWLGGRGNSNSKGSINQWHSSIRSWYT